MEIVKVLLVSLLSVVGLFLIAKILGLKQMAQLDLSELMMMWHQQGYFDLKDIQTAVFEFNGQLTVLPVSGKRPANPEDLNLKPPPASFQTEVIMDGRMLRENLRRLGLDVNWLRKQLSKQSYHSRREIFLGVCDNSHQLTFLIRA